MSGGQSEEGRQVQRRLVKSKSGLKIVCQHDREAAPWEIAEPAWIPDNQAENCIACKAKFDFIKRRHHCRRCGQIFCGKCSSNKVQFHRMGFVDPVRLCKPCSDVTKKEEEFFNNDLKLLLSGVPMRVSKSLDPPIPSFGGGGGGSAAVPSVSGNLYNVKLSIDQKFLMFQPHESTASTPTTPQEPTEISEGGQTSPDCLVTEEGSSGNEILGPVDLNKITEIETHDSEKIGPGGVTLQIKAIGSDGTDPLQHQFFFLKLDAPPEPSRKPSMQWNGALVKGLRMVLESRYQSELEDE